MMKTIKEFEKELIDAGIPRKYRTADRGLSSMTTKHEESAAILEAWKKPPAMAAGMEDFACTVVTGDEVKREAALFYIVRNLVLHQQPARVISLADLDLLMRKDFYDHKVVSKLMDMDYLGILGFGECGLADYRLENQLQVENILHKMVNDGTHLILEGSTKQITDQEGDSTWTFPDITGWRSSFLQKLQIHHSPTLIFTRDEHRTKDTTKTD